ncbi:MAG: PilZ domain-containing protein [Myxococcales bacterium]|jgi:hypothetical protein|nr:PilZ domain-containing protein [Myxococcales bacterium]
MIERRHAPRRALGGIFCNKYIDGFPHAVELLDLSPNGIRVRTIREPAAKADGRFPVQILLPGRSQALWLWTKTLRRQGEEEVLGFVGIDGLERVRIARLCA